MELHILLAGVEFGPYTDHQARDLIGEGFLSETDPAKRLDETAWLPLSEVLAQPRAGTLTEGPTAEEIPATEPEPAPSIVDPVAEEEPAAEPPPVFDWPVPEESEETVAPETSPASAPEEATATVPEPEPPAPAALAEPAPILIPPLTPSRRTAVTRELSAAEKTSFQMPVTKPLPAITPGRAPTLEPPRAPASLPAAARTTAPILSTTPLLQVSLPARAKKAMRTGSLLAQDALRAARTQQGALLPGGMPTETVAPSQPATPALVIGTKAPPSPAPPAETTALRRKQTVLLRSREETAPLPAPPKLTLTRPVEPAPAPTLAPPSASSSGATGPIPPSNPATTQRKAIRLTGRITLPGVAPKPELAQGQSASLSGPLVVVRPGRTGIAPRSTTRALTAREKSTFFIGEIARPADVARQEQAAAQAETVETASVPESKTIPAIAAPVPEKEPESDAAPATAEKTIAEEPVAAEPAPDSVAALLQAAGTETVAEPSADSGALPLVGEPPSESDLSASGRLLSSGELADRRSLKITGPLRHPAPRAPIRLSSPSKPGESARSPFVSERRPASPALSLPDAPLSLPAPLPPAPEESLPPRPQTGKIPVSAMPTEGIRIRTRRTTGKIPMPGATAPFAPPPALLPEAPAESSTLPEPPSTISVTSPHAEPAPSVPLTAEAAAVTLVTMATFAEDGRERPGPMLTVTPPAGVPVVEQLPAVAAASPVEAPEAPGAVAPDKVRLRRPVKLELSSRAKNQETGRLSLEAFSKMASLNLPGKTVPPDAVAVTEIAAPAAEETPGAPVSPPGPTSTPAPADFDKSRLPEAPRLVWKSKLPQMSWRPEWLAYAIITVGVVALCAVVYILVHRSHTAVVSAPVATSSPATPPSEKTVPPPSAAPPETAPAPPAVAIAPKPSVPAAPAIPAARLQDLNRQVDAYVSDGSLKYQHGDLDGALAADNKALNLNPKSAVALVNRGLVKEAQNDLDGSVTDYSAALQIDPTVASTYYYRGRTRYVTGDLDGALSDYNHALQLDPKNAVAFFDRGMIRLQKDDIDGSIVDSTRAMELDPSVIRSYYDRGLARLAKGSMDSALSDMTTFCQIMPQDAYTDYARLYIWLIKSQQGQMAEANQDLAKAMNSGWNGAADSMVTRIGEFLLGQISENELIKASASEIPAKDQGRRCEAWYFIGMRQLLAGDKPSAIEDLRKCIGTQKTDYCEYILAQEEVRSLSPAGENPAAPAAPRAQAVTLPDPGTVAPNGTAPDSAPEEK
jgi:tetratricopeptide (TPR) repeat protein